MKLPTQAELDAASAAFEADWGGVDEVLYGLCREHPGHGERRATIAKLVLVGRAYSAGLERQVAPDPGGQAITKIAGFVTAHAAAFDDAVSGVLSLPEPLSEPALEAILQAHQRLTVLLRQIPTRGLARSFAAKYLHFHAPVVPIYDSYAVARLAALAPWGEVVTPLAACADADPEYRSFCARFWMLYDACRTAGLEVTVKSLDAWLWQVPVAP